MSFEEFKKTIFYTQYYIRIPLLNIRLDKVEYLKKGKLDMEKINSDLLLIYDKNKKKLN